MKLSVRRTRNKYWEWYYLYLLPTIRVAQVAVEGSVHKCFVNRIEILWLTFSLCLEF